jgi:hypothetical protein
MHHKKDNRNGIFKIHLINTIYDNDKNILIFSNDINDKGKSLILAKSAYDSKKDIINAILKTIQ